MTTEQLIKLQLKHLKPTSREVSLFDPSLGDTSTRLYAVTTDSGQKLKVYAYTNVIVIEMRIETSVHFAIDIPDKVSLANKLIDADYGFKVYTSRSNDSSILRCVELIHVDIN